MKFITMAPRGMPFPREMSPQGNGKLCLLATGMLESFAGPSFWPVGNLLGYEQFV